MRRSWQQLKFLVLGIVWLAGPPARAQITPAALEIQVTMSGSASAYQGAPAVAWEPAGDFVIAWLQQSTATGGWDIWAQQYKTDPSSPSGATALAPAFLVSSPSNGACRQTPAVATDAAGDFVVVWQSNEQAGGTTGIYAQPYDATGHLVGPQLHVNQTTAGNDQAPAVAMAPDGRFLVVYQSDSADGSSWGVVARAFGAQSANPSNEFQVNQTTAGAQHSPAVVYLPGSAAGGERYLVVWQSQGQDGAAGSGASGIVGRGFNGAGSPLSGELAINAPGTGAHAHPRLAADPSGNFTVAWEDVTATGSAVVVRRFNAAGVALSDPTPVDGSPTGPQHDPVVAANDLGQLVVAWDTAGQDGSGLAVMAQAFDNYPDTVGSLKLQHPLGGKVQLNVTTDGDQATAGAGLSAGASLLTAWQSTTTAADAAVVSARAAALPALSFYTVTPCRLLDTRNPTGPLGGPVLSSGQVRNFPLQGASCQIPATAKAVSVNATTVVPSANGFLVAYPGDAAAPGTSSLNFDAGGVRANNAVLGLSRDGDGSCNVLAVVGGGGQVHFILDVNGYFQ
jgi:hypothetical protein